MLSRQCSIYDVEDIEAFVVMCIKRSGVKPYQNEWEDLVAEGIAMLWAMSCNYKVGVGCFSGYALKYMPRKLREAYHRDKEHHVYRTQDDGTRKWEYLSRAVSLNDVVVDEASLRVPGNFVSTDK